MRVVIKKLLIRCGVYYSLNYMRQIPSIFRWLNDGCSKPAPHAVKMNIVRSYLRAFGLKKFVETGTYLGDTLEYISREGVDCISIELSDELYKNASWRFKDAKNVQLLHGNSASVIPQVLEGMNNSALFWLDGHYSGGITAKGEQDSPISIEIEAIHKFSEYQHVILIDDARCFDGTNGYPHLDDLLHEIRQKGLYDAVVSADIIRLTPRPLLQVPAHVG